MWLFKILLSYHVIRLGGASITADEIARFEQNQFTVTDNGNSWTFSHHGVPDHGFEGGWGRNPNSVSEQNYAYEIPKNATALADGDEGCVGLGPVAMAVSGATFFNPYTAFGYNAVEGACKETFDDCNGHPNDRGTYHYHQLPSCIYYTNDDLRDVLLGVAFDGHPIYGPMDSTGKNWTSAELDKCHGHVYNGRYIYRVTMDFPYIMSCYRGSVLIDQTPMPNGGGGGRPRPPRQKREVNEVKKIGHRYMYKRQLEMTFDCNSAEEATWIAMTCWAVCENPSTTTCSQDGTETTPIMQITTTDDVSSGRQQIMSGIVLLCAVTITFVFY